MVKESSNQFTVLFTEEFELCLDKIQQFFAEQGEETLKWWFLKDAIIDYIELNLSKNPFMGHSVERGNFKGRRITYGKSKHIMLNYMIYYSVHEGDGFVDVINILPSRSQRKRVNK